MVDKIQDISASKFVVRIIDVGDFRGGQEDLAIAKKSEVKRPKSVMLWLVVKQKIIVEEEMDIAERFVMILRMLELRMKGQ